MSTLRAVLPVLLFFILTTVDAWADSEAPNRPHVATGPSGQCYARSLPADHYGSEGRTKVYSIGNAESADEKIAEVPLFAQQIFVACFATDGEGRRAVGVALRGPWARGHRPSHDHLALALYFDGAEVARLSTLDISGGRMDRVSCSVSHHQVIHEIEGYVPSGSGHEFHVVTVDGRRLVFDAASGELLRLEKTDILYGPGQCYWPAN